MHLLLLMLFLVGYCRDAASELSVLLTASAPSSSLLQYFFPLLFSFSKHLAGSSCLLPLLYSYFCSWVPLMISCVLLHKVKVLIFWFGSFLLSSYYSNYPHYYLLPFADFIACTLYSSTLFVWNAMCPSSGITSNLVYPKNLSEVLFPDNQTTCNFFLFIFSCSAFLRLYGILGRKRV